MFKHQATFTDQIKRSSPFDICDGTPIMLRNRTRLRSLRFDASSLDHLAPFLALGVSQRCRGFWCSGHGPSSRSEETGFNRWLRCEPSNPIREFGNDGRRCSSGHYKTSPSVDNDIL